MSEREILFGKISNMTIIQINICILIYKIKYDILFSPVVLQHPLVPFLLSPGPTILMQLGEYGTCCLRWGQFGDRLEIAPGFKNQAKVPPLYY